VQKNIKESGMVKELVWISRKREKYLDPARNGTWIFQHIA